MGSHWSKYQEAEAAKEKYKKELDAYKMREEDKKKLDEMNRSKEQEEKKRIYTENQNCQKT